MAKDIEASHDDDALSWQGDEPVSGSSLPRGWRAVGKGSEGVPTRETIEEPAAAPVSTEPKPMSNVTLVIVGIFAGAYLLYTIGWIISGLNLQPVGKELAAGEVPYAIGSWIAAAAPAAWFALSYYITRNSKSWTRFAWLVAGMVLLVPWPFVMMGVGA